MSQEQKSPEQTTILGLSRSQLAGLTVDELTNNPTAIKMLLHYYGQLLDDNTALRNNNNTLETYVSAYKTKKSNAATGMVLLTVSNVSVAFGVDLLTSISATVWPGISSLVIGMALITAGIYFSFFKDV